MAMCKARQQSAQRSLPSAVSMERRGRLLIAGELAKHRTGESIYPPLALPASREDMPMENVLKIT